jgi:hypothetical protein
VKHTQPQAIEIAYLMNGELVSVRRLSKRSEWRSALSAFGLVAALSAGAAALVGLGLLLAHRVLFMPAFLGLWAAVGLGAAALAAARAAHRARSYDVGTSIDDDAFAALPMRLVRREKSGYRLVLAPGFTGRLDGDRAAMPIEALVREVERVGGRTVEVPLDLEARAEISSGTTTFVVRSIPDVGPVQPGAPGAVRRFARRALLPLELAALGSIFCAIPTGAQISEADMRSAISPTATPWEIEKALRAEAQTQAQSLHQCFDVLPISCQHSGYVGVGVSLSRDGEMRDHWIARSTYSAACPVDRCMSDVISTWFFEPLPQSMRLILPVQVLRTDRPLPYGAARAAADRERTGARQKILAANVVN